MDISNFYMCHRAFRILFSRGPGIRINKQHFLSLHRFIDEVSTLVNTGLGTSL